MLLRQKLYACIFKNIFDRFCASIGLLFFAPLYLVIATAIKIDSNGPILFCHNRIGVNGKPFGLYKFRSMVQNADKCGPSITKNSDPRITTVGHILRKYKIDELPQLLNVFFGHISLVGPRPEVRKYVDLFWEDYQYVLMVKPGITDYAALEFIKEQEILDRYDDIERGYIVEILPHKIELYKKYIKNMCFTEDIRIILKTVFRLLM